MPAPYLQLARQTADLFAALPQVVAVALAGSRGAAAGSSDSASDIDLYVYTRGAIPLAARRAIVERTGGATLASLDLQYWGPGDEWLSAPTGIEIDIVYFDVAWMEDQIARVVERHEASLGYTTCFWHTIRQSVIFFDPHGWLAQLQRRCQIPYPEALRRQIIALNHPVLRAVIPAYANQIAKAVRRRDLVSVNHRIAALLASYFDIIFALNRRLHPGEKRQVELALSTCDQLPAQMEADLAAILLLSEATVADLPGRVATLLDRLDELLAQQ